MTTAYLLTNQKKKKEQSKHKEGNSKNQIEIDEIEQKNNREKSMKPHPEYIKKSKTIKNNLKNSKWMKHLNGYITKKDT